MKKILTACIIVLMIGPYAFASATAEQEPEKEKVQKTFYDDRYRGYYSYEQFPEEDDDKIDPGKELTLPDYTYDELWHMPIDKLRKYIDDTIELAVHDNSEKNIKRYLMVNDLSRRKSLAFASAVALYGQMNPEYSVNDVVPITIPGQKANKEMQTLEVSNLIKSAKHEFGLVMVTKQGCLYCDAQRGILSYFNTLYQWPVKEIDMEQNPSLQINLGVETTPTILIVKKDGLQHNIISTGVVSMSELEQRIYRMVKFMRGETTPDQFPMFDYQRGSGLDPLKFLKSGTDQIEKR